VNTVNSVAPDLDESTIELGAQLATSAGLVLLMIIIHTLGLLAISKSLNLSSDELKKKEFDSRSIALLGTIGLLIFLLHLVEIVVFAGFYLAVSSLTFEESLYYSASAYATLGRTAEYFPSDWRLIGAIEALIGFILIGWSTAFVVSTMNTLRD
jgi:hypothetical protein